MKHQAQSDPREIYRSAPGMEPLGARILSNELGDMSQFNNERQLFSYRVDPCEQSSGDNIRRGHITRQETAEFDGFCAKLLGEQSEQTQA